jgi:hypothetical protein
MGGLILIAIIVGIAFAARSPRGTRVLGRVWLVLSALWIAAIYLSVSKHMAEPGYMDFGTASKWALIPPAATLALFFVLKWIMRGAERRPGD